MKKHPKDVTLADLGTLTTKDLLAVYNHHAAEPITRFQDHPSAFRRTKALLASIKALPTSPSAPKVAAPKAERRVRSKVLVAPVSHLADVKEYHSVLAAFKALKLPLEKHQRFRRQVKLTGKAIFNNFVFNATYK